MVGSITEEEEEEEEGKDVTATNERPTELSLSLSPTYQSLWRPTLSPSLSLLLINISSHA